MQKKNSPKHSKRKRQFAIAALFLGFMLLFSSIVVMKTENRDSSKADSPNSMSGVQTNASSNTPQPLKGVWISVFDFSPLGLSEVPEDFFRAHARAFLQDMQEYGINTVFFHARAFDDASWKSKIFPASEYLTGRKDTRKTAAEAYSYDPLGVFLEETHKLHMTFHAWMNPYRISYDYFLDPADTGNQKRILQAVDELLAYDIDGIHFDDYFYQAQKGYCKIDAPESRYSIISSEAEESACEECILVPSEEKRKYVNQIVRQVHRKTAEKNRLFGISPAGNYAYDMESGADVLSWMTDQNHAYIDYIIPQIYWSDQWGENGTTSMYMDRLEEFTALRKNDIAFYVGLALYKAGTGGTGDIIGWMEKSTNLLEQIQKLEEKQADGYVFFSAQYFYAESAKAELQNLKKSDTDATETPSEPPQIKAQKKSLKILSIHATKGTRKITGSLSTKNVKVKIKIGTKKYQTAQTKETRFSLTQKKKLRKGTSILIFASKKGYRSISKTLLVY